MATKFITPSWRMPKNSNQSKASNYSIDFDPSSNNFIQIPQNSILEPENITVSCWVNITNGSHANCYYVNKIHTSGNSVSYGLYKKATPQFIIQTSGGIKYSPAGSSIVDAGWTHLVGTYDGSYLRLYINGAEVGSGTAETGNIIYTSEDAYIGAFESGLLEVEGKIGPVSIFDYALTDSAVTALYNGGIPSNPLAVTTPPVAYYNLGQGSAYASGSAGLVEPNLAAATGSTVFDFNSSDSDFINLDPSVVKDFTTDDFSISTWIKGSSFSGYNYIFQDGATSGNRTIQLLNYTVRGGLEFAYGNGTTYRTSPNISLNTDQWYHVVATYSSVDGAKVYIDGNTTPAATNTNTIALDRASHSKAGIGAYVVAGNSNFWDGEISNMQIWNGVITPSEVETLYNNGTPLQFNIPQSGSLKAWYKLGLDSSNWDGSNWVISRSPFNYSKCLNFPNQTDNFKYDSFNMNGKSEISFSFWYNHHVTVNANDKILGTKDTIYWAFEATQNRSGLGGSVKLTIKTGDNISSNTAEVTIPNVTNANSGWNLFTGTYDGSNFRGYLNGVQVGSDQPITGNLMSSTGAGSRDLNVTVRDGGGAVMEGMKISNFVIWDKGLTSSEVATLLNGGTPFSQKSDFPQQANMLLWNTLTDMNTSSGGGVFDNSGNGVVITSPLNPPVSFNLPVSTNAGFSSGMDTTNLVPSNLIKSIPYSGYSMLFDLADDDSVNCGTDTSLNILSDLSISIWFKTTSSGLHTLINRDQGSGTRIWNISISEQVGQPYIAATFRGDVNKTVSDQVNVNDGNWHNVIAVYDPSTFVKLYVDGILEGTDSSGIPSSLTDDSSVPLYIGAYSNFGSENFDGHLSNASIFNRILTEDEILRVYNGGSPGDLSNLNPTSWWSLGADSYFNGSNWICPDIGANTNNGTSANMGAANLVGDGPDSLANGTSTNLDLASDLIGEAPGSTGNAISINMNSLARTGSTP